VLSKASVTITMDKLAELMCAEGRTPASFLAAARQGDAMSFGLYSIGFAILIGGLIYAAHLMHMPAHWIVVGAVVLLGIGILSGVKATRQKDSAE
jgi:hypothetical protein